MRPSCILVAAAGRFTVTPGVYVLSAAGPVDAASLPADVGHVGFAEYHAPPPDTAPPTVVPLAPPEIVAGRDAALPARVVETTAPDSVTLFIRPVAGFVYRRYPMHTTHAYEYSALVMAADLPEGPYEYSITVFRGDSALTFPSGVRAPPNAWNYYGRESWHLAVVSARTPLVLFDPAKDASHLAFSRIGDAGRLGLFRLGLSEVSGRPVFHLELPVHRNGEALDDYTASLVIADKIRARGATVSAATDVRLRLRGLGPHQILHVTLMEDDGTSWTAEVPVDSNWSEPSLPLSAFTVGRGVLLPEGFPGEWNYWVGPAAGRGGSADRPRLDRVERLQLSLRRENGVTVAPGSYGVEVEAVTLGFGEPPGRNAPGR